MLHNVKSVDLSVMATTAWVAGIAICAVVLAWFVPLALDFLRPWELHFHAMARRPLLASALLGLAVLLLRAALLPVLPIPQPAVGDELSNLLGADTFLHGRLASPVHPMWPFFESAHILVRPSYATKYFPGQALVLAAGQLLMGHPWFGVWLSCGLMTSAIGWAAFGWLPPGWALFAGSLILPMSILSYWMNSYWGGAVAGIGGALVTGAAGRILSGKLSSGIAGVFAMGSVVLCYTRPLEGLVLITCLLVATIWKLIRNGSVTSASLRMPATIFAAIGICGAAWLGYYNFRVTGSPLLLPEALYQRQYGNAPFLIFLPFGVPKELADPHVRLNLNEWERGNALRAKTIRGQVARLRDETVVATSLAGNHWLFLIPVLIFGPWVIRDRRIRILLLTLGAGLVVAQLEIAYLPHYAAPFCAIILILATQGFRHLRALKIGGRPMGRFLSRAIPAIGLAAMMISEGKDWMLKSGLGDPLAFAPPPGRRASLEESLPQDRQHVILVRYEEPYQLHSHWVYNHADIDGSRVVWVHDLGPQENKRLLAYYPHRQFWLLRPNRDPNWLEPYQIEFALAR